MPKAGQGQTTFYTARKDRPPSKFAGRLRIRGYRLHMWLCVQWSGTSLAAPASWVYCRHGDIDQWVSTGSAWLIDSA